MYIYIYMFFKRTTPIVVSDELLQELRFQANDEGRNASDPPTPWQPHTQVAYRSVAVSSQKATAHWHKYVAPMAYLQLYDVFLMWSMAPCQHSKSKWEGGCVPYVSSDTSVFRLLPKWRILQALLIFCQPAGIRWQEGSDSIYGGKKGHVLNLHLGAKTKTPRWIRWFCLHFSGNHGSKVISFRVLEHTNSITFIELHACYVYIEVAFNPI